MGMLDDLQHELVLLHEALRKHDIPFLLGGGMGLFLRDLYHPTQRQPGYPFAIPSRSTKDLDLFLSATVIADAEKMNALRDILMQLGYHPLVEFFQFERELPTAAGRRSVRVDLLAPPPREEDQSRVKVNRPRIRPKGAERIHAFLTQEARGIHRNPVEITLPTSAGNIVVRIPSSYNYLILKLHAFNDRFLKSERSADPETQAVERELAQHHAFDIFRIVTDMSQEDWRSAIEHRDADRAEEYLRTAARIRSDYFAGEFAPGILAIHETEAFRNDRAELERYVPQILRDLDELFSELLS